MARTILSSVFALFTLTILRSDTGKPEPSIRLSQVIAQISTDPAFRERLLESLDNLPNAWGLLGPKQRARLREFILHRDWSGIDHFPALTVAELRASVMAVTVAVRGKASLTASLPAPYVEIGSFRTDRGAEVDWQPSPAAELNAPAAAPVQSLGYGLATGDPPHPELWRWHKQSVRAAWLFNRLALNPSLPPDHVLRVRFGAATADKPILSRRASRSFGLRPLD